MIEIAKHLYTFLVQALSYIFIPPFCTACKKLLQKRVMLCEQCSEQIAPIVSTALPISKKHSMKIFAVSDYREPLKSLILAKGWSDRVASCQLGELIWHMTYIQNVQFDYIVPVPLHWTKLARRGFNQAEQIAQILAKKSNKQVVHLLHRVRKTIPQSQLKHDERDENVKGAFALQILYKNDLYKGAHFLLVDDLMTTGATLTSSAKTLFKLQPATITAVVACRVV